MDTIVITASVLVMCFLSDFFIKCIYLLTLGDSPLQRC